jgi:hypothetical protein
MDSRGAPFPLKRAALPRILAAGFAGWSLVALIFAAHGYWFGQASGRPQPWWPSLGYTLAVFSVWALLTPLVAVGVWRTRGYGPGRQAAMLAAGLPATLALHAALFMALFWPVYSDGGRQGPWAVAEGMLLANLHTDVLFYAAIAAGAAVLSRRRPASEASGGPTPGLRIRARGRVAELPLCDVDWIEAAGNYAQAHAGERTILVDESLAGLARRLPADAFARIHRRTIVRLELVSEVRGVGRGDACVRLRDGTELRLSRRYRPALRSWLERGPARPAHDPARGSEAGPERRRP